MICEIDAACTPYGTEESASNLFFSIYHFSSPSIEERMFLVSGRHSRCGHNVYLHFPPLHLHLHVLQPLPWAASISYRLTLLSSDTRSLRPLHRINPLAVHIFNRRSSTDRPQPKRALAPLFVDRPSSPPPFSQLHPPQCSGTLVKSWLVVSFLARVQPLAWVCCCLPSCSYPRWSCCWLWSSSFYSIILASESQSTSISPIRNQRKTKQEKKKHFQYDAQCQEAVVQWR